MSHPYLKHLRRRLAALELRAIARLSLPPAHPRPFGLDWMRAYLPHYLTSAPSQLHLDLAADLADFDSVRGQKRNTIAPRGSAKTTWQTKGKALHSICERTEKYILLLSDTGGQAKSFLDAIKRELASNPAIRRDYPSASGEGESWGALDVTARNGVGVTARGAGGRVRGLTRGAVRPTLVIVDDPNEKTDAFSPTTRQRKWDWFVGDVLPVGGPDTNFLVAGTPIHRDTICYKLKNAPGWQSKTYRSLDPYPDRMDLWGEWGRLATNAADSDRMTTASAFYAERKAEMDAGAGVLWPDRYPLETLMLARETLGQGAFDAEFQDEPGADGAAEFPADYFARLIRFDQPPSDAAVCVIALDPSKGADSQSGDYQAIVTVWVTADGTLWADCQLRREPAPQMAETLTATVFDVRKGGTGVSDVAAEVNAGLGLLIPAIEESQRRHGCIYPLTAITNTVPKVVRVRRLAGYLSRGQIRVRSNPGGDLLIDQLREFPNGKYDDGPDALELAVRRCEDLLGVN